MAFNWETFKTRSLTATIFVAVMLSGLLLNQWTFFILFSIIHFGCWIEYQRLIGRIDRNYQDTTAVHKYGIMIAGWCLMLCFATDPLTIFGFGLHELGEWLGVTFLVLSLVIEFLSKRGRHLKNLAYSFFGLIYISLSLGLMVDLGKLSLDYKENDWHRIICIALIASIWINDTMAYIIGSIAGKHPLSKISPKKTWEGTIGGAVLSIALIAIIGYYVYPFNSYKVYSGAINIKHWIGIAAIGSVAGTFGDLLESKLKRMAGVKDSGSIMPGHGGFLDRFDSLLVAIPFAWLYAYFFMR
jgi:phosphatidate cytidylyltransferase